MLTSQAVVPSMALQVFDRSMQLHGAEGACCAPCLELTIAGICQDTFLPRGWSGLRTLRYADVRLVHVGARLTPRRARTRCTLCRSASRSLSGPPTSTRVLR